MMNIRIAYDNEKEESFMESGWGFSAVIGNILFDTGDDGGKLLSNLARMDISPASFESVVISHDHWDHHGGLWDLLDIRPGITVYACPGFTPDFRKKVRLHGGELKEAETFMPLGNGVYLSGEIEGVYRNGPIAEQAIALETEKGISICTGCAHPGITVIAEKLLSHFPGAPPYAILGGFHLKDKTPGEAADVFDRLKSMGFQEIDAGHCSGDTAKRLSSRRVYAGLTVPV